MISPIYFAFLLLSGLLLWFVIGARGKWTVKLAAIVIVPMFMFFVWGALGSFSGWPTHQKPDSKTYYYVYGYVIEPDVNIHVKGAVYVWLIPNTLKHAALDYAPKLGEPRAFVLPYSRKLEGQINQANRGVAAGKHIALKTTGKLTSKKAHTGGHLDKGSFHFYDLPPVVLPRKGNNG